MARETLRHCFVKKKIFIGTREESARLPEALTFFRARKHILLIYAENLIPGIKNYSGNRENSPQTFHVCHVRLVSISSLSLLFCSRNVHPLAFALGGTLPREPRFARIYANAVCQYPSSRPASWEDIKGPTFLDARPTYTSTFA